MFPVPESTTTLVTAIILGHVALVILPYNNTLPPSAIHCTATLRHCAVQYTATLLYNTLTLCRNTALLW